MALSLRRSLPRSPKLHTPPRVHLSENAFDPMMERRSDECPLFGNDEPSFTTHTAFRSQHGFYEFLMFFNPRSLRAFAPVVSTFVQFIYPIL
jgi:hypothetical protein